MGYGYGRSASGRLALACDNCGTVGGVRKRHCPHTVLTDSARGGTRHELRYCYPAALCSGCFKTLGGTKALHKDCAAGAARSQAEYDAKQARLDAGEHAVLAAWGDWAEGVPEGKVGVLFGNGPDERWALLDSADYDNRTNKDFLLDFPSAVVGEQPAGLGRSKRVA